MSEIEDDGSETDRMHMPSEVVEAGGETDRMDVLSEVGDAGSEADRTNALLGNGDAGDNGDADWREAHLDQTFERIYKQKGVFEVPKISSQGRVMLHQAFLRRFVGVFFLGVGRE